MAYNELAAFLDNIGKESEKVDQLKIDQLCEMFMLAISISFFIEHEQQRDNRLFDGTYILSNPLFGSVPEKYVQQFKTIMEKLQPEPITVPKKLPHDELLSQMYALTMEFKNLNERILKLNDQEKNPAELAVLQNELKLLLPIGFGIVKAYEAWSGIVFKKMRFMSLYYSNIRSIDSTLQSIERRYAMTPEELAKQPKFTVRSITNNTQ